MLIWQGLIGEKKYTEKDGVLQFIQHIGCIQYDPIDICGKNADLVLQSRIKEYKKNMLEELLYEEKKLMDCYDKNLSIIPINRWQYFQNYRENLPKTYNNVKKVDLIKKKIKEIIRKNGHVCSKDLEFTEKIHWGWGETKVSRIVLELMQRDGELIVHHKIGNTKYYVYTKDYLQNQISNYQKKNFSREEYIEWRVLMRIVAVGVLWNKASDAWIGISFNAKERNHVIDDLLQNNKIVEIYLCEEKYPLYIPVKGESTLLEIIYGKCQRFDRMEFIAPLDSLLWDRKLIEVLFNFSYKWEIYTTSRKRKYGPYILPILYNDKFIGRIEIINDKDKIRKSLSVKNIWLENDVKVDSPMKESYRECLYRFMKFNKCNEINGFTSLKE